MYEGKHFEVHRDGMPIQRFPASAEGRQDWVGWMQNYARRSLSAGQDGPEPDIGVDPDGKRYIQLGYLLMPESDVRR